MAFNCVTGCAPDSPTDQFIKRSDVSTRTARNSQKLQIPFLKSATGQRSFYYRTVKIWNALHPLLKLRAFALIVTAHPYCTRKFECHVMHRARVLSTKMNNDRAGGHCYGFAWILRSSTFGDPYFLFRNRFYLQLSPYCPKINKKSLWEVKKISRFLPTGHGIQPCCGCKARKTMVTKCELVV